VVGTLLVHLIEPLRINPGERDVQVAVVLEIDRRRYPGDCHAGLLDGQPLR